SVQHAQAPRPAADADREPRPRLAPGRRPPGEGRLPLLRPQARLPQPLLPRRRERVPQLHAQRAHELLTAQTRLVGLIGNPVSQSLSPAMQNAAFAARALDWAYLPLLVEEGQVEDAIRGLVALGFAGANVTAPHKAEAARLTDTELDSVNTLIVRDGHVEGHSTDTAILDGLPAECPAIIGAGGAAAAFRTALP